MSDVTPLKKNIQIEAVTTGAAASEAVMQQIAGSINHLNKYTCHEVSWNLNGPYYKIAGAQSYVDGHRGILWDYEIVGLLMWNGTAGASGDTELDVTYRPAGGGSDVSIFSTKPKIPYTAGNNAYIFYRFDDNSSLVASSGVTNPVLSVSDLSAGDILHLNILQKQNTGENAGLTLFLRSI